MKRTKAPRRIGVLSLWGEPEVTVTVRKKPSGPKIRAAAKTKAVSPSRHLANVIVTAYVGTRMRLGLSKGDETWRAELGQAARIVAASESFPEEVLAEAAVEFAQTQTKRRPAFFVEWVREAFWRLADREHALFKQQERAPLPPAVAAAIGGLQHVSRPKPTRLGTGPRRKVRCQRCFEIYFEGEGATVHVCNPATIAAASLEGRSDG